MCEAIMSTKAMKPLLIKAKEEPVSAAIGLTDAGDGVILLSKVAKPSAMLGMLRKNAGSANVKLESLSLRFGRAEIDTDDEAKLVKFTVNKEGSEKLRKGLQAVVRQIQFQKVVILVDQSLEQDEQPIEGGEAPAEEGQGTTLSGDLLARTQELDKLEQILRRTIESMGSNLSVRPLLIQSATAVKAGRESVSKGDSEGATAQIKLAMNALRQISSATESNKSTVPQGTTDQPEKPKDELPPPVRQRPRSEQVQHAVSRRLLTGEEVMQRLDKRPKKDVLGGLFKRSTRFKSVLKALKPIDDFMNQTCDTIDTGSFAQAQRQMTEAGNKALAPLDQYWEKLDKDHTDLENKLYKTDHGTERHRKAMVLWKKAELKKTRLDKDRKHLSESIQSYQGDDLAKTWEVIKSDPGFEKVKNKITVGQAIQLKSCGINFSDVDLDNLKDSSLDKEKSKEAFGSGGVNSVSKLTYRDGTEKVFKPMQDSRGRPAVATYSGISRDDPHYENRNVTSRFVGDVLGTDVIPESTVGIHNGRVGLMMDVAKGSEPHRAVREFLKNPDPKKILGLQQQLMDLEWCDMISGQMDRHNKNYLVDMSTEPPKVTGIDNDLAFGPATGKIETLETMAGYNGFPKPRLIGRKTFEKLMQLDFDRHVQPGLQGRLTEGEIKATKDRFNELQQHARSLDSDFIVDDWASWRMKQENGEELTSTEYLMLDKKSLFGRDFGDLGKLGV